MHARQTSPEEIGLNQTLQAFINIFISCHKHKMAGFANLFANVRLDILFNSRKVWSGNFNGGDGGS